MEGHLHSLVCNRVIARQHSNTCVVVSPKCGPWTTYTPCCNHFSGSCLSNPCHSAQLNMTQANDSNRVAVLDYPFTFRADVNTVTRVLC